jgi:hypothetical protein
LNNIEEDEDDDDTIKRYREGLTTGLSRPHLPYDDENEDDDSFNDRSAN